MPNFIKENFSKKEIDAPIEMLKKMNGEANEAKFHTRQKEKLIQPAIHDFKADNFFRLISNLKDIPLKEQLNGIAKKSGYHNIQSALNLAINKNEQSPLHYALQKQNFAVANIFLNLGATVGPEEKAIFEVARDSKAARDYGLPPLPLEKQKLHPVKKFGLVLGIVMTSVDGTFSQIACIGPTYQLMTDFVSDFAKLHSDKKNVQEIAEAFLFSNTASAFRFSTSMRNPEAGNDICARIQSGKLTTIPVGCAGHVMGLSYVPDGPGSKSGYLVYTNRGLGAERGHLGTDIFRIDNSRSITPQFINNMLNGLTHGTSHDTILSQIKAVTGNKSPVHHIRQSGQKRGNCTIANPRSNVEGILLCQKAIAGGGFDRLTATDIESVKKEYKQFTYAMRLEKVNELASELKKNPADVDLNNLAKEYLKQHADADPKLKEPLERILAGAVLAPSTPLNFIKEPKNNALGPVAPVAFGKGLNILLEDTIKKYNIETQPNILCKIDKSEALKKQQEAAIHSVLYGEPKPVEGFFAQLVNAIKYLSDGISNAFSLVARCFMGLKA